MNLYTLLLVTSLFMISVFVSVSAQSGSPDPPVQTSFRPSIAIVVGIFSILFSLTFLLLMYAKFCHSTAYEFFNHNPSIRPGGIFIHPNSNLRSFSGIDKTVIESLPFFRFSSLKGSRDGLECAVCISKFDDAEILRLLPKCKHAFHIDCVDKWLESHSTCPLCRYRIDPDDVNMFKYSNSSRFLFKEENEDIKIDIFVERECDANDNRKKDEPLMKNENDELILHKFKHRIIVSDVVFKSRWSDINSSDFVSLDCDMLNIISSKRFKEKNREMDITISSYNSQEHSVHTPTRSLISPGNRCMSEIANISRFQGLKNHDMNLNTNFNGDEKIRRVWLPIARKTVQLFSGKEGKTEFDQHNSGENSNV